MDEMQVMQNESITQLEIMSQLWVADRPESGADFKTTGEALQKTHQLSFACRNRAIYIAETALIGRSVNSNPFD